MRFLDQSIERRDRAVGRIDAHVVRHVVAEVGVGRGEDRGEPDRVDAQPGQV